MSPCSALDHYNNQSTGPVYIYIYIWMNIYLASELNHHFALGGLTPNVARPPEGTLRTLKMNMSSMAFLSLLVVQVYDHIMAFKMAHGAILCL